MANAEAVAMEEDKPEDNNFSKSTLQMDGADDAQTRQESPMISRARPGSIIGRQSIQSTTSRTSIKPNVVQTEKMSRTYFSYLPGVFDHAVQMFKDFIKKDLDGDLIGAWLLTLVDHWDLNHERVFLLTEYSLFVIKYDFVCMKLLAYRRIQLHLLTKLTLGDLRYPTKSLMYDRLHGGVKIEWEGEQPSFGQMWNPFSQTIPWIVISHHPLLYDSKETETVTYNVDDFYESLILQVSKACQKKGLESSPPMVEEEILIDSYASLASMVFNQSNLGFFKSRGDFRF